MPSRSMKRAFVLPFFAFLAVVLIHSAWQAVATQFSPVWIGPLLVAGGFFGFMGWLMQSGAARTSANLPGLLVLGAAGVVVAVAGAVLGATPALLPVSYALVGFTGLLLYVFWYSRLGRQPSAALRVGETLPTFEVTDERGETVSSLSLRGHPVVWLFFRGNWCPLCMAQIRELAERYKQLEARGVAVALVSPQSHENTQALARRFDVPFRFFVDAEGRAARALGIFHEAGVPLGLPGYGSDTVLPTAIVTDADGRIVLADQTDNYRVRPEPDTFLAALDGSRA